MKRLSDSPFLQPSTRRQVHVAGGAGAYANTRAVLAKIDLSPALGKKVLLKPNAGRMAACGSGIVTHKDVVAAAIDAFREADAKVAVGESPITGVQALAAFELTGIAEVARQRNCPLIDMDARPCVNVGVPDGVAMQNFKVCPEVFEHDLIVSIPVTKMHMHTGVTLAVKNMKGCLWRRSKVQLHMIPPVPGSEEKTINLAIADMASFLRPHLSIIDGTVGLEGLGPSAGQIKPLDVVVAGADAFAADAVACRLMGMRAEEVPHLRLGAERGHGVIDLEKIDVAPGDWRKWILPFAAPPASLAFAFPNITVLDQNSCSACQSTLLLFLKKYGAQIFDYFPGQKTVTIAIGKGHADVPPNTLCLGNCTARHRQRGIFVPGCPPVGSEIIDLLQGKPAASDDLAFEEPPNVDRALES